MTLRSRAQRLFGRVKSHPLTSSAVFLSTEVVVNAGVIKVFRSHSNEIGLMIPISDVEHAKFRSDTRSASLRLTAQPVEGLNHIRLALTEPRQEKIFAVFVDEILSTLEKNPDNPATTVSGMLKRWRELFKESRKPVIWSYEQELGLLCELEVLYALHMQNVPDIVKRWTGPEGFPHDFELESESVECKSTSSHNGLRVTINGISQLNPTGGKSLRLVVRNYAPNPDGPVSVPNLIEKIHALDFVETEVFFEKLQKLGCPIFELDDETYFGRYEPIDSFEFQVNDAFPRITNIGAEERIQRVSYSLDLSDPTTVPGYLAGNLILSKGVTE